MNVRYSEAQSVGGEGSCKEATITVRAKRDNVSWKSLKVVVRDINNDPDGSIITCELTADSQYYNPSTIKLTQSELEEVIKSLQKALVYCVG